MSEAVPEEHFIETGTSPSSGRRLSRTLTQRYDMHSLRALQDLEVVIYEDLAKLCNCDEDDVPVDLDLLKVFNANESDRNALLTGMLKGAPGDKTVFIEEILQKLLVIESQSEITKHEYDIKSAAARQIIE